MCLHWKRSNRCPWRSECCVMDTLWTLQQHILCIRLPSCQNDVQASSRRLPKCQNDCQTLIRRLPSFFQKQVLFIVVLYAESDILSFNHWQIPDSGILEEQKLVNSCEYPYHRQVLEKNAADSVTRSYQLLHRLAVCVNCSTTIITFISHNCAYANMHFVTSAFV